MRCETLEDIFPLVVVRNAIIVTTKNFLTLTDTSRVIRNSEGEFTGEFRQIDDDGSAYAAIWVELYNKEEIGKPEKPESLLTVVDLEGNRISDHFIEKQVKLAAIRFRVRQIQEEYDIGPAEPVTYSEIIHNILTRVWAGEWMGQFNSSGMIYFSELADILNVPMIEIFSLVEGLVIDRKADVLPSSYILVAPEGDEPRKGTENLFGHAEYSSSDFGYWSCAACEQHGDDYSDPRDYPCKM